jgi:hypothetical protein
MRPGRSWLLRRRRRGLRCGRKLGLQFTDHTLQFEELLGVVFGK